MSKKYTELPDAGTLDGTEIVSLVKGGISKRSTVSAFPFMPLGSGLLPALTTGYSFIGNGSNTAVGVPLTNFPYRITLTPNSTAVAITPGVDPTNRITISAWSQSSGSGTSFGDGVRMIAEHGRTKLGLKFFARGDSAVITTVNTAPFNVTTGQTLIVVIDGGAPQTITFSSGTITSGAATADEIANRISAVVTGAQAVNYPAGNTDVVRFSSDSFGVASTIQITGGTANTGLGFITTLVTGVAGVAMGDGQTGLQKAWFVCHDKPNDLTSANRHGHVSVEVSDSTGAMQTRLGFEYDLDITRATFSSCQVIVNENAIITSAGTGSNKEYWFAKDNQGQPKSRLWLTRVDGDANANWRLIAVNDAGVTDTILIGDRLLSRVLADASIQLKQGSSIARSTTLSPLCAGGNSFLVTGTGTASYMKIDTWQAGSVIVLELPTSVTIGHNVAGSSPGVSVPFFLKGLTNYVVGANGGELMVRYNGTFWKELTRTDY